MNKTVEKILCVDDEDNILNLFRRTLGRQFTLYTASSAEAGLALLRESGDFAVVVSDYSMPGTNGLEFLKQAKQVSPDSVQVMLTGNIELDVAIKAINETDVFRYLPKPCPIETITKVISDALELFRLIKEKQLLAQQLLCKNQELVVSNQTLAKQKYLLEYELDMARIVYGKLYEQTRCTLGGLDCMIVPKDTVGGDFLLTQIGKQGETFYLMMGDLTGHGLQSALAVLLVNEIFDMACAAGPCVEMLAKAINDKMCRKLPTGLFCAALLVKLDFTEDRLHIWQGGIPDAYLSDAHGRIRESVTSNNLPLGVLAGQELVGTARHYALSDFHALFACTDGLTEQLGEDGTMFGVEQLLQAIDTGAPGSLVDRIMARLQAHRGQQAQGDDITLFDLNFSSIGKALSLYRNG